MATLLYISRVTYKQNNLSSGNLPSSSRNSLRETCNTLRNLVTKVCKPRIQSQFQRFFIFLKICVILSLGQRPRSSGIASWAPPDTPQYACNANQASHQISFPHHRFSSGETTKQWTNECPLLSLGTVQVHPLNLNK
jgi:hypothetical protein